MNIPSFNSFVVNERKAYAYIAILALGYLFYIHNSSQNEQADSYKKMLNKCESEKSQLNNKIQYILEKQQELTNKKKPIDSL